MNALPDLRAVAEVALRRGDRPFIVSGDRRLSFAEFVEQASAVGAGLDVEPGERVAILAQNSLEWCLAFWGAVLRGAVVAALNGWWEADEVAYALEDCGASLVLADEKRRARVPEGVRVVAIETLRNCAGSDPPPNGGGSDPAVILYTSGTTGRPKGVICTHHNITSAHASAAAAAKARAGASKGPRTPTVSLLTSPLFHVSGLHGTLIQGLLFGQQLVLVDGRITADACLDAIEREGVTAWAAVPTVVWRVCQADTAGRDLSSLRRIQYGGSPAGAELQRLARATFPNLSGGGASAAYGMTETNGVVAWGTGDEIEGKPGCVGRPFPGAEFRIDEDGEIFVRGPMVTPGYWGEPPRETDWLASGDIGHLDDDGYLYVTDRKKDVIIRGGENVYSVEIEQRLLQHPDVLDAAVVGVPHDELGEEVKAIVVGDADPDDLRAWVGQTLAAFKVPAHVEIRDEPLPRTASGKILKMELR